MKNPEKFTKRILEKFLNKYLDKFPKKSLGELLETSQEEHLQQSLKVIRICEGNPGDILGDISAEIFEEIRGGIFERFSENQPKKRESFLKEFLNSQH